MQLAQGLEIYRSPLSLKPLDVEKDLREGGRLFQIPLELLFAIFKSIVPEKFRMIALSGRVGYRRSCHFAEEVVKTRWPCLSVSIEKKPLTFLKTYLRRFKVLHHMAHLRYEQSLITFSGIDPAARLYPCAQSQGSLFFERSDTALHTTLEVASLSGRKIIQGYSQVPWYLIQGQTSWSCVETLQARDLLTGKIVFKDETFAHGDVWVYQNYIVHSTPSWTVGGQKVYVINPKTNQLHQLKSPTGSDQLCLSQDRMQLLAGNSNETITLLWRSDQVHQMATYRLSTEPIITAHALFDWGTALLGLGRIFGAYDLGDYALFFTDTKWFLMHKTGTAVFPQGAILNAALVPGKVVCYMQSSEIVLFDLATHTPFYLTRMSLSPSIQEILGLYSLNERMVALIRLHERGECVQLFLIDTEQRKLRPPRDFPFPPSKEIAGRRLLFDGECILSQIDKWRFQAVNFAASTPRRLEYKLTYSEKYRLAPFPQAGEVSLAWEDNVSEELPAPESLPKNLCSQALKPLKKFFKNS